MRIIILFGHQFNCHVRNLFSTDSATEILLLVGVFGKYLINTLRLVHNFDCLLYKIVKHVSRPSHVMALFVMRDTKIHDCEEEK